MQRRTTASVLLIPLLYLSLDKLGFLLSKFSKMFSNNASESISEGFSFSVPLKNVDVLPFQPNFPQNERNEPCRTPCSGDRSEIDPAIHFQNEAENKSNRSFLFGGLNRGARGFQKNVEFDGVHQDGFLYIVENFVLFIQPSWPSWDIRNQPPLASILESLILSLINDYEINFGKSTSNAQKNFVPGHLMSPSNNLLSKRSNSSAF